MSALAGPRGRLFQHSSFVFDELRGCTLEKLLGFADDEGWPIVMFLKVSDRHWHRFFLDAGINFWSEVAEDAAFDELSEEPHIDYGAQLGVIGRIVGVVHADDTPCIRIALSSGELVYDTTGLRLTA